jgi:hypothetical protein
MDGIPQSCLRTNDRFLQVSEFVYITRQQKNKLTEIASGDFVPQSPSQ